MYIAFTLGVLLVSFFFFNFLSVQGKKQNQHPHHNQQQAVLHPIVFLTWLIPCEQRLCLPGKKDGWEFPYTVFCTLQGNLRSKKLSCPISYA